MCRDDAQVPGSETANLVLSISVTECHDRRTVNHRQRAAPILTRFALVPDCRAGLEKEGHDFETVSGRSRLVAVSMVTLSKTLLVTLISSSWPS
jgi:hypothetical protein